MKEKLVRLNNVGDYKLSFIAFLFLLLFGPPVIPQVNTGLLACLGACAALVVRYRGEICSTFRRSGAGRFSLLLLAFLGYLAVVTLVSTLVFRERVQTMHYVTQWYRFFLIFPCLTGASLYICLRARELHYTPEQLGMCFVWATCAQFVLAMAAMLIPQLKEAFIAAIYRITGDQYLKIKWITMRRGFGYSNSFVDSFGWGMGIIAALPFFAVTKKNFRPVLLVPVVLFVSLVNARTGLLMAAIGGAAAIPWLWKSYSAADRQRRKKALRIVIAALLILCLLLTVVFLCNKITLYWAIGDVLSFIDDVAPTTEPDSEVSTTRRQLADSKTSTADVLFSDRFWNLPPAGIFLFGCGHSIFGAEGYPNSDVGYVNDLWLGGVVGCALLYGAFGVLFLTAYRRSADLKRKLLTGFLAVSFALFQIKANAIMFCAGLNVMLPMLFYLSCYGDPAFLTGLRRDFGGQTEDDLVSVIVPVYKVEAYLARCVESILAQSYRLLQVILVDDGSPDRCGEMCDGFAEKDARVTVLHTENGGLSAARNAGLAAAAGDYVAFVDSDDFVRPDYIAALLTAAKENDAKIAACGSRIYYNSLLQFDAAMGPPRVYTPEEALRDIFTMENNVHVVAWNKLYRRSLFADAGIRYPAGKLHEDVATTYRLCAAADRIAFTPMPCYYYVQRKGSIMGGSFSEKRLDLLEASDGVGAFLKDSPYSLDEEYAYYAFLNRLTLVNALCDGKHADPALFRRLSENVFTAAAALEGNRYYGKKNALTVKLLCGGEKRYRAVRRVWAKLELLRNLI